MSVSVKRSIDGAAKVRALRADLFPLSGVFLTLAVMYRRLLAGWVLANGDLHTYFFPYWAAAARALKSGQLPLWNAYLFGGAPLLANSQAGIFYPPNWLLWLCSASSLAGVARALHWSVLLHLALAAFSAYVLARRLGVSPWGAVLSALLYAGSGFLGLHVEHLNQLQGLAWLPLVLLPGVPIRASALNSGEKRVSIALPAPISVLALAMILLAGHTQTAFIAILALVVWRVVLFLFAVLDDRYRLPHSGPTAKHAMRFVLFFFPFALAGLIAAVQLLPTFELSRFSMRSGGLPWREAISFSIRPWELPLVLLPPYLITLLLPEGVAYLGVVGLFLAGWGAWLALKRRSRYEIALVVLCAVGVFLALGGYNPLYLGAVRLGVPGLVHFRAPARYLSLYILAGAMLAGLAFSNLGRRNVARSMVRVFCVVLCLLVVIELLVSAEYLPHADATALRAYTDLRPATAHLVAAARAESANHPPGRLLSISQTLFDAGDEVEMEAVYGDGLSSDALWAYKVAAKYREVLAPNFPLAFKVPAVDGYDGGLLPTQSYVAFSQLLLPGGTLDGRLRENLTSIPEGRWLSLLDVRFLMTDKTGDAWVDDVFYDRQFQPNLAPGEALSLAWLPQDFKANALGLLYEGEGAVELTFGNGDNAVAALPVTVGESTLDAIHPYRVRWPTVETLTQITVSASGPGLTLTGASLIDERTTSFYPLVLSNRFRLAHSGDVKIYENLHPIPRAFWVGRSMCVSSDVAALEMLRDLAFDPASQVVLQLCEEEELPDVGNLPEGHLTTFSSSVRFVSYSDTWIVVDVAAETAGVLVLTDAWYPGWHATITSLDGADDSIGKPVTVPVLRADLLFRGVRIAPGRWRITFEYHPTLVHVGGVVSLLGCILFGGYAVLHKRID